MGLEKLAQMFGGGPLAVIAGAELIAISILFTMLVRSLTARADQSAKNLAAAEKFLEVAKEMNETLADVAAVRTQRSKRKAGEKTGEYRVPIKPTGEGT